jgi:hypothetical protein
VPILEAAMQALMITRIIARSETFPEEWEWMRRYCLELHKGYDPHETFRY